MCYLLKCYNVPWVQLLVLTLKGVDVDEKSTPLPYTLAIGHDDAGAPQGDQSTVVGQASGEPWRTLDGY